MELVDTEIADCSCAFELNDPIDKMDVKNSRAHAKLKRFILELKNTYASPSCS
jgi:hypothetical protein